MRTIIAHPGMRIVLGKQGENEAVQVVWPDIGGQFREIYGEGVFTLAAKRFGDAKPYPVPITMVGTDAIWLVRAADVANPGKGSCELTYTVNGVVAKTQTWSTYVAGSISGNALAEPPEDPAKAWFSSIQSQIGDLGKLTTNARENLVAAINEAAETGSGDFDVSGAEDGSFLRVRDGKVVAEKSPVLIDLYSAGVDADPSQPGESLSFDVSTDIGTQLVTAAKNGGALLKFGFLYEQRLPVQAYFVGITLEDMGAYQLSGKAFFDSVSFSIFFTVSLQTSKAIILAYCTADSQLPDPKVADDGAFLRIENGKWVISNVPAAEGGTF